MVREVIRNRDIRVLFQPIVNMSTRQLAGAEALSRGDYRGRLVEPYHLFRCAGELGQSALLDSICREEALKNFLPNPVFPLLFLNYDPLLVAKKPWNPGLIPEGLDIREAHGKSLASKRICLELNEQDVGSENLLAEFSRFYREKGFLLALDDVGAGRSNLQRISRLCPDVVKIDRALVKNIDKSQYCQEIFKSIVRLARGVGALTVAMGTSSLAEVTTCMELGADYLQGFFFSRPVEYSALENLCLEPQYEQAVQGMEQRLESVRREAAARQESLALLSRLAEILRQAGKSGWDDLLQQFAADVPLVECAYLLDDKGVQVTDVFMKLGSRENYRGRLALPPQKGKRHDIKNYYYAVKEDIEDPFVSDCYLSDMTGNRCRTISTKFVDLEGRTMILCMDIGIPESKALQHTGRAVISQ